MPGFNRRGPRGEGPRTGLARGRCRVPDREEAGRGRGFGRGRGRGAGGGRRMGGRGGWGLEDPRLTDDGSLEGKPPPAPTAPDNDE
jgi:hypothetical protein